ncbi:MAG: L-threonylcarbamoyladenylate synthase, partial [Polyangiaceae bacterium]
MPRVERLEVPLRGPIPAAASAVIAEAARILRGGGLVAFPTETVYGLGARAADPRALARVFEAKGRPAHHPLIAHVESESQARDMAASWPERASRLATAFWPGPLTLVVERAPRVPAAIAGGGDSIAVRAPSHPVARALIAALEEPIAAPSANLYTGLSPTTAAHVIKQLGDAVDLVIDGGACDAGIESTVVDVRGETPWILRPGAVSLAALRAIVPEIRAGAREAMGPDQQRPSPGMDARHYAPHAPLRLVPTRDEACRVAREMAAGGALIGLIVRGEGPAGAERAGVIVHALADEPTEFARALYATLHALDDAGVLAIVVHA